VLGGTANFGGSAADMIGALGVTKQAASQLIDTLVLRGYLDREVNPDDRRRMTINLTERGRAAAGAVRAGIESVDAELAKMLPNRAGGSARRPDSTWRDQGAIARTRPRTPLRSVASKLIGARE
jgi:predicted ArsR family transcriptional regulator